MEAGMKIIREYFDQRLYFGPFLCSTNWRILHYKGTIYGERGIIRLFEVVTVFFDISVIERGLVKMDFSFFTAPFSVRAAFLSPQHRHGGDNLFLAGHDALQEDVIVLHLADAEGLADGILVAQEDQLGAFL